MKDTGIIDEYIENLSPALSMIWGGFKLYCLHLALVLSVMIALMIGAIVGIDFRMPIHELLWDIGKSFYITGEIMGLKAYRLHFGAFVTCVIINMITQD